MNFFPYFFISFLFLYVFDLRNFLFLFLSLLLCSFKSIITEYKANDRCCIIFIFFAFYLESFVVEDLKKIILLFCLLLPFELRLCDFCWFHSHTTHSGVFDDLLISNSKTRQVPCSEHCHTIVNDINRNEKNVLIQNKKVYEQNPRKICRKNRIVQLFSALCRFFSFFFYGDTLFKWKLMNFIWFFSNSVRLINIIGKLIMPILNEMKWNTFLLCLWI